MNNEPVAWRKVVGNVTKHYQYNEIGEGTPLYTHPAKEQLTDGEILNIYLEQTNGNKDLDILEFAKAILRKAQEK